MDNSLGYATDGYFKTVPLSLFYVQIYKLESDYVFDFPETWYLERFACNNNTVEEHSSVNKQVIFRFKNESGLYLHYGNFDQLCFTNWAIKNKKKPTT